MKKSLMVNVDGRKDSYFVVFVGCSGVDLTAGEWNLRRRTTCLSECLAYPPR